MTRQDPDRLPHHTRPTHYDLRIEPDFTAHAFIGHEIVTLSVTEPTSDILLNATELEISSAMVFAEGQQPKPEPSKWTTNINDAVSAFHK